MARLFFAIPLPTGVRTALAAAAAAVLPDRTFRLIPEENLHITIAFLGETSDQEARRARVILPLDAEGGASEHTMELGTVGAFPRMRDPRVVWVGVRRGRERLSALHGSLTAALRDAGIDYDKKEFHPHLTLAYRRRGRGSDPKGPGGRAEERTAAVAALEALREELGDARWSFPCPGITLYESRLTAGGAVHRAL